MLSWDFQDVFAKSQVQRVRGGGVIGEPLEAADSASGPPTAQVVAIPSMTRKFSTQKTLLVVSIHFILEFWRKKKKSKKNGLASNSVQQCSFYFSNIPFSYNFEKISIIMSGHYTCENEGRIKNKSF